MTLGVVALVVWVLVVAGQEACVYGCGELSIVAVVHIELFKAWSWRWCSTLAVLESLGFGAPVMGVGI